MIKQLKVVDLYDHKAAARRMLLLRAAVSYYYYKRHMTQVDMGKILAVSHDTYRMAERTGRISAKLGAIIERKWEGIGLPWLWHDDPRDLPAWFVNALSELPIEPEMPFMHRRRVSQKYF